MSSLDRWIPLPWEWDADVPHSIASHSMVNWCVTHCSGSAGSWTKGAADLRSISPTTHTCSNYSVTRLRGLECTEKSLGLEGGQCQNERGNGGWNGEEREDRFRAKQGNEAKLEQDGGKPSAAKAKELWEGIVLQPGPAAALQRRLCSQKSWECSAMDKDCCPLPLSWRGAAGEACTDWLCQAAQNEQCQCTPAVWMDLVKNTAAPWGNLDK